MSLVRYRKYMILIVMAGFFCIAVSCTNDNSKKEASTVSSVSMPTIHIETNNKANITDNEMYLECFIDMSECEKQYKLDKEPAGIRLRGNSTLTFDKKSYRMKFNEEQNLLGQGGGAKSWVLLANHCDPSLLRNYLALNLGSELEGIEWSPSANFIELYLNDEYQGVYLLCEQVQVHEARVNVETKSEEVDTGFLIELDKWAVSDGSIEGLNYFLVNKIPYSIKSMDDQALDEEKYSNQIAFIQDYVLQVSDAIYGHDRLEIEQLIDMDSCVDMYILLELFKNIDAGWSLYMYKDQGGKLFFGPPWDLDTAAGNDYRMDMEEFKDQYEYPYEHDYEGIYVGIAQEDPQRVINKWSASNYYGKNDYSFQQRNDWYIELMKCDWFQILVKKRFNSIESKLESMLNSIDAVTELYSTNFEDNFKRWNVWGTRIHMTPKALMQIDTQRGQAEYLKNWLESRIDWLTKYLEQMEQTQ